jgi:hypothetical protein
MQQSVALFILISDLIWVSTVEIGNDSNQNCILNASAENWASRSCDLGIRRPLLEQCGPDFQSASSELVELILTAMGMMPVESSPLCVVEVGTGDGSGTTVALMHALYKQCQLAFGRGFHLYTYEGMTSMAQKATDRWAHNPKVTVINEHVMDEDLLDPFVIAHIEGPDSDEYPGKPFHVRGYAAMRRGDFGSGFLRTRPPCAADLVLIDSSRFAHAGIVATLLRAPLAPPGEVDPRAAGWGRVNAAGDGGPAPGAAAMAARGRSVFVVEDDWAPPAGAGERAVLARHWRLLDLIDARPAGEMWPWFVFRVAADSDSDTD